jgi:hypothetical protein
MRGHNLGLCLNRFFGLAPVRPNPCLEAIEGLLKALYEDSRRIAQTSLARIHGNDGKRGHPTNLAKHDRPATGPFQQGMNRQRVQKREPKASLHESACHLVRVAARNHVRFDTRLCKHLAALNAECRLVEAGDIASIAHLSEVEFAITDHVPVGGKSRENPGLPNSATRQPAVRLRTERKSEVKPAFTRVELRDNFFGVQGRNGVLKSCVPFFKARDGIWQ